MAYYDSLIAKWPSLGAAAIEQPRIDAAKAALATPHPTIPPDDASEADQAAYVVAANAWHMGYAAIFNDPAVLVKLDAINTLTVAGKPAPASISVVVNWLRENGLWLPIKAAVGTSAGAAAAVDLNDDVREQIIDFSLARTQAMVADLVTNNLLSAAQAVQLAALGTPNIPWWQSAGYSSPIGTGDLEAVFVVSGEALV
jgi:hypothetical protein